VRGGEKRFAPRWEGKERIEVSFLEKLFREPHVPREEDLETKKEVAKAPRKRKQRERAKVIQ